MVKLEFTKDVKVRCHSNICCFSGDCRTREVEIKAGSKLKFLHLEYVPSPGPGKSTLPKCRFAHLYIDNERGNSVHPDYLENVPLNAFIIKTEETNAKPSTTPV